MKQQARPTPRIDFLDTYAGTIGEPYKTLDTEVTIPISQDDTQDDVRRHADKEARRDLGELARQFAAERNGTRAVIVNFQVREISCTQEKAVYGARAEVYLATDQTRTSK